MSKENTTLSVLVPISLLKQAEQLGINRSEASRQGIRDAIEREQGIYDKRLEVERLRKEKQFGHKLRMIILDLKKEVKNFDMKPEEINTDPYIKSLIDFNATEIQLKSSVLSELLYNILLGNVGIDDLIDETRIGITEKFGD